MKQSSNFLKSVAGGLGATTFFALTVSGVAFWSANRTLETNRQITRHLENLRSLKSLDSAFKDAENMQRQYLLTGKKDAVNVFGLRMIDVDREIRQLETSLQNHLNQQAHVEKLKASIFVRLKQLRQGIELRQSKGLDAAIDRTPTRLLNEVTLPIQEIEAIEIVGLREKQQAATSAAIQAIMTFLAGIILNLGIIMWTYHLIVRETVKRNQAETDLQKSNQIFQDQTNLMQSILDSMSDGLIVADENGQLVIFNPVAKKMFGIEIINAQQKSWTEEYGLFQPDRVTPIPTKQIPLVRALRGEEVDNMEIFARDRQASEGVWLTASSRPLKDVNGVLKGGVVVFRNISERKQVELVLQQSEERFRSLIEATSQIVWTTDAEGAFVTDQPQWRAFTGQTVEEIQGWGWLNMIHPEDRERTHKAWSTALAKRIIYEAETRIQRYDGEYRYFNVRGIPILNPDNSIREWVGANTDITERKQAEQILRQTLDILDSASDSIIIRDMDDRIIYWNRGAEILYGWKREEVIGQYIHTFLQTEFPKPLERVLSEFLELGHWEGELHHITRDGRQIIVASRWTLQRDPKGESYRQLEINNDISDRKSAELEILQAKEAAEAANRTKSEFLANMNHELRTPLNGILGYAQILQRDPATTPKQHKGLGVIYQCGSHLLTLINDILDLSKLEAQKMDLYPQDFHFGNFLTTTVEICRIKAEQKGIAFHYHPAHLPTAVYADDKRLRQVLLNLLGNAVKFTDFGSVTFTVEAVANQQTTQTSTRIRFQVEDTGIGVPKEKLQSIFLPFEQAGKRDRNSEGTGLGLAISQQIVQMMGSSIQVNSTPGKGSNFWFEVDVPASDWLAEPVSSNQKVIGYQGERQKILVIDDRLENRAVVMGMLAPLGFKLAQADDGQAGLDLALQMRPDLIITDVMMSNMNGLEMTRRLRQLPDFALTPIIACPASLSQVDMQQAMDAGCSSFFPKPIEFTGLLGELQRHLELQWIYETTPQEAEVSAEALSPVDLVMPSSQELATLYQAAQDGFMSDIQQEANRLKQLNPQYAPFANKLLELSQKFDDEAILNLLAPHI
ncbi:histidine kinase [Nostoc sp. DSM 114161]|jgi:PAS domain S-box-containing protein|uniref:PAS domain S-box protein n=1 Tax=Nostoc sp. DSM 114161 TaxID=3440143 RepID=UPI0040456B2B